ncbi:MAG: hypothetical protein P9X24_08365 [Candidatus Hatepunaea meridiana]|nr:hypothetical protein [Candidatus Hatepunaea meridiana]
MKWFLFIISILLTLTITGCEDEAGNPTGPIISSPTELTALPLSDSIIRLRWIINGSLGSRYQIERAVEQQSEWNIVALLSSDTQVYTDADLAEGVEYHYRVSAFQGDNYSAPSNVAIVTTHPKAPQNLIITTVSYSTVNLVWEDISEVETGYEIQRRQGINGDFETIIHLSDDTDAYFDTNLSRNGRYFYRIRAQLDTINSLWSNEAKASTVPAPSGLLGKALSDSSIWLGWRDNSSNETGYRINRNSDNTNNWNTTWTLNAGTEAFTDLNVHEGGIYWYFVLALFENATSQTTDTIEVRTPPETPTDLVAFYDGDAEIVIHLTWHNTSQIETGFELQRKSEYNYIFETIALLDPGITDYYDSDLTPNVTYIYHIRTLLDTISSVWSNEVAARTTVLTPLRPTDLFATALNPFQVRLLWSDNANNELGYIIERSSSQEDDWAFIDTLDENIVRYYDSDLTSNTRYWYRICAYNQEGNSPFSDIADVMTPRNIPECPTDICTTEVTYASVGLVWQDNSDNELGFRIARQLLPWSRWDALCEVGADVNTFTDTTVNQNTDYAYKVAAFNETGESVWSHEVQVSVPDGPPGTPRYLHVRAIDYATIYLIWSRTLENEDGFRIERRSENEDNFSFLAETGHAIATFRDTLVESETWYYYRIQAYNEVGISGYSNVDSTWTPMHSVFWDDFEDYHVGSPPSNEAWSHHRRGTSFVTVSNRDAYSGEKSVMFNDPVDDDSSYCALELRHDPIQSGSVECWLNIADDGCFRVSGVNDAGLVTFQIQFNNDNTFTFLDNYEQINREGYPVDEWFYLKIFFNLDDQVYSIIFNEQTVVERAEMDMNHRSSNGVVFAALSDRTLSRGYLDYVVIREHNVDFSTEP